MKPIFVFGATGYVGAELIRWTVGHPAFELTSAVSSSQAEKPISDVLPAFLATLPDARYESLDTAISKVSELPEAGIFLALPHGESARLAQRLITDSIQEGRRLHLVDLSADFRFADPNSYEAWHGSSHPASDLISTFFCGHPELHPEVNAQPIAHPGCFTTSVTLPLAPLWHHKLIAPNVQVSGVTGSTGSGREPKPGTHHPDRHGGLWAYSPLTHRHAEEMEMLVDRHGESGIDIAFVPHSGPFTRGILSTIFAEMDEPRSAEEVVELINGFYVPRGPFVRATSSHPSVKHVAGSNFCRIGVTTNGTQLVMTSAIDNLIKGAAGGAMQWMNRLVGLPDETGLMTVAPGWM
ncbi:MAG: N-acetyl-gamma-glutamyl-phosphate reductase [Fimbriimonadaceae bacterium]|nr:N-acetyl-gamma-glutamyl-phosphate reductase [Fimbriimonadaceae bacterium]